MTISLPPNRMKAQVAFVSPIATVTGMEPVATVAYVRLKAAVLLVNDHIEAFMADAVPVADAISKSFGKALTDALALADNATTNLIRGSELNGLELNGVELNG